MTVNHFCLLVPIGSQPAQLAQLPRSSRAATMSQGAEDGGAEDAAQKAARLKAEGNAAFRAGEHSVAVRLYTEALEHGAAQALAEQHLLYSNRSQAFLRMAEHEAALRDADRAIELAPEWHRGYARRAGACVQLGRDEEAFYAYEKALQLAPGTADYAQKLEQLNDSITKQYVAHRQRTQGRVETSTFGYLERRVQEMGGSVRLVPDARDSGQEFGIDWDELNPQADPPLPEWWPESAGLDWGVVANHMGEDAWWSTLRNLADCEVLTAFADDGNTEVPLKLSSLPSISATRTDGQLDRRAAVWPPPCSRARRHLHFLAEFRRADTEARAVMRSGPEGKTVTGCAVFLDRIAEPLLHDDAVIAIAGSDPPVDIHTVMQQWNLAGELCLRSSHAGICEFNPFATPVPTMLEAFRAALAKRRGEDDEARWSGVKRALGATIRSLLFQVIFPLHLRCRTKGRVLPSWCSCRLFLGPGFRLGAPWNRLG